MGCGCGNGCSGDCVCGGACAAGDTLQQTAAVAESPAVQQDTEPPQCLADLSSRGTPLTVSSDALFAQQTLGRRGLSGQRLQAGWPAVDRNQPPEDDFFVGMGRAKSVLRARQPRSRRGRNQGRPGLPEPGDRGRPIAKGDTGRGGVQSKTFTPSWYAPGSAGCRTFTYRQQSFCIPQTWWREYQNDLVAQRENPAGGWRAEGLVSGVPSAMQQLLPELSAVAAAAGLAQSDGLAMAWQQRWNRIACWNLPVPGSADAAADAKFSMFYGRYRAPEVFYGVVYALAELYAEHIDDVVDQQPECKGFGRFVRSILRDGSADGQDCAPCVLRLNYRNAKPEPYASAKACGDGWRGKAGCSSLRWDNWTMGYNTTSFAWQFFPSTRFSSAIASGGANPCQYRGYTNRPKVYFHAAGIASRAAVFDRIMLWARLSLDFHLNGGGLAEYAEVGRRLGRYALSAAMNYARLLIHELGHVYMPGSGHCKYGCCWDVAAAHWQCKVAGVLGLPLVANTNFISNVAALPLDFSGAKALAAVLGDGWGKDSASRGTRNCSNNWTCGISATGQPEATAAFCSNSMVCVTTGGTSSSVYHSTTVCGS